MTIDMQNIVDAAVGIAGAFGGYFSGEEVYRARVKIACAIIHADAIHNLADAVRSITTGTDEAMGISESLCLLAEKIDNLDCETEIMEIADSIKGLNYD